MKQLWQPLLVTIWLLLIGILKPTEAFAHFIDTAENTELIQQRAGFDVKLQCNLTGLVDERKLAEIKIQWFFKQCSDNNCYQLESADDWTALPCESSLCRSELWLRNVTERYSGLYKCSINPHVLDATQAVDVQLVRTYQLDVKNSSLAAPEFLDAYPSNKTATKDSRVVFQCRVHSEEHPTIKWFRRRFPGQPAAVETPQPALGTSNFSTHIVRYGGRTYELLATPPEKLVNPQIYLSKLIINSVQLRDTGFYACVAISYRGHKIREAFLEVVPPEEEVDYWADYGSSDELVQEDASDPRDFLLLFLMPVGLAMLPLSVWGGYMIYKRCTRRNECERMEQQYSDEELDTERYVLGGS
ncbi:cell adhesion molecule-related/down-regulated by oncogenes [Drosophila nasuta]|uniref:cell adhesion molecule-related/down-regulated by oncogenes n=1 Tax=Drosophila nasuta TaxID=42062 RepID=UPI00295F2F8F|nr:cell adhesion molecule-related/down-regulated by oncogenes [Drosophila nasuta]XP_060650625.1 cell adhesion molecule-related/down-regulated by oncogenes [Drosophila nasuta]